MHGECGRNQLVASTMAEKNGEDVVTCMNRFPSFQGGNKCSRGGGKRCLMIKPEASEWWTPMAWVTLPGWSKVMARELSSMNEQFVNVTWMSMNGFE
jgi:hypothetical protein